MLEQAELFHELSKKTELSQTEQLQMTLSRQAMQNNGLLTLSEVDTLREPTRILGNKIAAFKENSMVADRDMLFTKIFWKLPTDFLSVTMCGIG